MRLGNMRLSKWFLIPALTVGLVSAAAFGAVPRASADDGPHGGYDPDTGACAGCHRAHTAIGEMLLKEGSVTELCLSCHDGSFTTTTDVKHGTSTGGARLAGGGFTQAWRGTPHGTDPADWNQCPNLTNPSDPACEGIDIATHGVGEEGTAWGGASSGRGVVGTLECTSCHNPHGSTNFRLLRDGDNGYPYDKPWVHRWLPVSGGSEGGEGAATDPANCSDDADNDTDTFFDGDDPECLPATCWDGVDNDSDGNTDAADADCEAGSDLLDWVSNQVVPVPEASEHDYSPDDNAYYGGLVTMGSGYGAAVQTTQGMSAWCATCHKQYLTKSGSYEYPSTDADHYVYPGTQALLLDESDDSPRYRHAVLHSHGSPESPLRRGAVGLISTGEGGGAASNCGDGEDNDEDGDIDLADSECAIAFGTPPNYGATTCLTCHFAHGSAAANSLYGGSVAPTNDNALLYYDNRGVCRACHMKNK